MDDKNFPYTSLCVVTEINDKGVGSLKRFADLMDDQFQTQFNSSAPPYGFLRYSHCPLNVNFVGVFDWRIEPHLKKDGRDFIDAKLCFDKIPIEIVILENCTDENDLRNKLLNGINLEFSTDRILFAYRANGNIYRGVLCSTHDFNDDKKLKAVDLDLFEVNEQNFIRVGSKIFYNGLRLEKYIGMSYSKNFSDFVKEKIIARAKLATFKNRVSKEDFKIFCDFIKNFSSEDFYSEIAYERAISIFDAKNQFEAFIHENEKYLQTEIFQDEIFENIIKHCPRLLEKFEQSTAQKWYTDNQEKINAANLKLAEIQQKVDEELKNFLELENDVKNLNSKLEEINTQIKQRKNFAAEVENKIVKRIDAAKKNVADFICEMAFINPNFGAAQTSKNNFYRAGEMINGTEIEIEDEQDFIYTLETEIGVEGTQDEFAAYLTAAYTNKILLLLAGPNARDIADAFSVTLTGKTAAIFDCANVTSLEDLEVVLKSDDEIISVLNPFAPNFIAYLPELVNIGGKFIFAIYPFAEDLKIEPRSFYNYFLPVFTELIIDKPPIRDFPNRYFLPDKIKEDLKAKYKSDEVPISAEGKIKTLVKILGKKKSAALFADFPLAYVKGKEEKFIADFKGDEKILERIRAFLGEN